MNGFSDEERERIREQLIETGRELLRIYGPRKTTVEDVTEPVGIAKSTFYLFFDSKTDLYIEIIERESDEFLRDMKQGIDEADTPREALERIIGLLMEFAGTNPLVQYRDAFLNSISPEKMKALGRSQFEDYIPVIESLQDDAGSPLADYEPEAVLGVMGTAEYLALHKENIEMYREGYYEEIREVVIPVLATGLMVEPQQ